jgi:starch synthase
MGASGRRRVLEHFSWSAIADRTVELYRSVLG